MGWLVQNGDMKRHQTDKEIKYGKCEQQSLDTIQFIKGQGDGRSLFRIDFRLPGLEPFVYISRPVTWHSERAFIESGAMDLELIKATTELKKALRARGYQPKGGNRP
jgi:hypothetical protein